MGGWVGGGEKGGLNEVLGVRIGWVGGWVGGWAYLQHIEELKGFHLKPKRPIHHQEDEIGGFGQVKHRTEIIGRAFKEGNAFVLACYHCDWT